MQNQIISLKSNKINATALIILYNAYIHVYENNLSTFFLPGKKARLQQDIHHVKP